MRRVLTLGVGLLAALVPGPARADAADCGDPAALPERLDQAAVVGALAAIRPMTQACFEQYGYRGVITVEMVVSVDGRVVLARETSESPGNLSGDCLVAAVRSARFPCFRGDPMRVSYPFVPLPAPPAPTGDVRVTVPAARPGLALHVTYGEIGKTRGVITPEAKAFYAWSSEVTEEICAAPCTQKLPRDRRYYVDGPGMVRSANFTLPEGESAVDVAVRPGSFPGRISSIAALTLGAGALAVGVGLELHASRLRDQQQQRPWTLGSDFDPAVIDSERNSAIGFFIGGGVAVVAGIVGVVLTRTVVSLVHAKDVAWRVVPGGVVF